MSSIEQPWRASVRVRLFTIVFAAGLALGFVWTVFQPLVYRSSATVLMSAPEAIDAAISEADVQNVAIQRTVLLGSEITGRLREALAEQYDIEMAPLELRALLSVEPLADTNLVDMAATGSEDLLLPVVVDTWINVYLAARSQDIEQSKRETLTVVQGELDGLAVRIEEARDALEQYRADNSILSVERQENEVMARLDGLNRALNTAVEEEVKARANLDTLRDAIARGEKVVPKADTRSVAQTERELEELRARLLELEKRYTDEYIAKQAEYRAIPERIAELEGKLAATYSQGQSEELRAAQQAHAASVQAVRDLEGKLEEHKAAVEQFNRIYATHEALAEDVARLEELYRETQARLVQVEVRAVEKYPQVSVIEPPATRAERVGPNYLLLVGGTLAGSTALAVFAVWLYGFLAERRETPAYVTLSGVHYYSPEGAAELPASSARPKLASAASRLLEEGPDTPSDDPGKDTSGRD